MFSTAGDRTARVFSALGIHCVLKQRLMWYDYAGVAGVRGEAIENILMEVTARPRNKKDERHTGVRNMLRSKIKSDRERKFIIK